MTYVEVAHEALLQNWSRLVDWIQPTREDLLLRRQVGNAAVEWHQKGRPEFLLWPQERLVLVYEMQDRLKTVQAPINPELTDFEPAASHAILMAWLAAGFSWDLSHQACDG